MGESAPYISEARPRGLLDTRSQTVGSADRIALFQSNLKYGAELARSEALHRIGVQRRFETRVFHADFRGRREHTVVR